MWQFVAGFVSFPVMLAVLVMSDPESRAEVLGKVRKESQSFDLGVARGRILERMHQRSVRFGRLKRQFRRLSERAPRKPDAGFT